MALSFDQALWFFPLALPICLYIAFTDMRAMRIPNGAVLTLIAIYAMVGPLVMPLDDYLWRYLHLIVALVIGIALNAGGAMGAGDAKFIAAAAPMIALGDLRLVFVLFAMALLAAVATHRLAKHSRLRKLAPTWESWNAGAKFPMGLALGMTLAIYLGLGLLHGA
jgi:prepilin peptidase CpaA